jgi:hypothetical protein
VCTFAKLESEASGNALDEPGVAGQPNKPLLPTQPRFARPGGRPAGRSADEERAVKKSVTPLDLAKRATASVAEIAPADAARIWSRWDQTFGRAVQERTGRPVFGGIRWHAFSWNFMRAEGGLRAIELYAAEPSAELLVLLEGDHGRSLRLGACAPIDFSRCGLDLYVIPCSFDWTMVFTHEQPSIGPFFCRRNWTENDENKRRSDAPVNCVYFACVDHREYVDAGYRWAYWTLEDAGVVQQGCDVDATRLLAADEYWNPPAEERSDWLCGSILPAARSFLQRHAGHRIVYVDEDRLALDADQGVEWMEAGEHGDL